MFKSQRKLEEVMFKSQTFWPKCPGCDKTTDMLGMLDTQNPVCMKCVRARARTARSGKCECGNLANPGDAVNNGIRQWIPCRRCLGHHTSLNDVCRGANCPDPLSHDSRTHCFSCQRSNPESGKHVIGVDHSGGGMRI